MLAFLMRYFRWNSVAWGRLTLIGVLALPAARLGASFYRSAEPPSKVTPSRVVSDVELEEHGGLEGVVVDSQGIPVRKQRVSLWRGGRLVAESQTGPLGRFSFQGLQSGVYEVDADVSRIVCRLWSPGSAPPAARQGLLLVATESVVRGQFQPTPWISKGAVMQAGMVAGALVAPAVVYQQRSPAS